MANPTKRTPFVVEAEIYGFWFALDAYRTREEAEEMMPVFQKRATGATGYRVRDIRETPTNNS
jgi:hypothetical protein